MTTKVVQVNHPRPYQRPRRAPRGRPVDILSALYTLKGRKVSVAGQRLYIQTDKRSFELPFADAVAQQIISNIQSGKNPSGKPQKPVTPRTIKERGDGPRGIRTGRLLGSIRVEEKPDYVGVAVTETAPGQIRRAFGGARWTYNPKDSIVKKALEDLLDVLLLPLDVAEAAAKAL